LALAESQIRVVIGHADKAQIPGATEESSFEEYSVFEPVAPKWCFCPVLYNEHFSVGVVGHPGNYRAIFTLEEWPAARQAIFNFIRTNAFVHEVAVQWQPLPTEGCNFFAENSWCAF